MAKKKKPMVINMTDLLIHSKDKLGRHIPEVRMGCGIHKSKKKYNRKKKHKEKED